MRTFLKIIKIYAALSVLAPTETYPFVSQVKLQPEGITICVPEKVQDIKDFLDTAYSEDESMRWFIAELYEVITKKWFIDALKAQSVWLAYYEEQVIGMAILRESNPWREFRANGVDRMELRSILISKRMRSRGIGKALFQVLQDAAKIRGASWLTVNAIAEAIPFYVKLGFHEARGRTDIGFFMEKRVVS